MYSYSYWENELFFKDNDLVIIGSGIVGLGAASFYKERFPKSNVLILERGSIPVGASTRNAGFACYGSLGEISDDLNTHSLENILALMKRRYQGLLLLRNTLGDENIGYQSCGSYELFDNDIDFEKAYRNIDLINEMTSDFLPDKPYQIADFKIGEFGFRGIKHLIFNKFEGSLDPGKIYYSLYTRCVALGVKILNGIEVKEINKVENYITLSNGFIVPFNKLLICTNAFTKSLLPDLEITPGRGLILVTKPVNNLKLNGTFHYQQGYFYFRNVGNRLLIGGGRNLDFEGETTTTLGSNPLIRKALIEIAKDKIVPYADFEIEFEWSGIMAFGPEKNPLVKRVAKNVFCAVRMGGMGVAIGLQIASEVLNIMED